MISTIVYYVIIILQKPCHDVIFRDWV